MSRQGRLTLHSCKQCKKVQVHMDTLRMAGTIIADECSCHPGPYQLVDTKPPYTRTPGYGEPYWVTIRVCRECGTQVKSRSLRMVSKEKGGPWERGRP